MTTQVDVATKSTTRNLQYDLTRTENRPYNGKCRILNGAFIRAAFDSIHFGIFFIGLAPSLLLAF